MMANDGKRRTVGARLQHELVSVSLATLFFGLWIGGLFLIKTLILEEYRIEIEGFSVALIGVLVLAKVVLVLEHVPLGSWIRARPAWVEVVMRTLLYSCGVFIVMVLEKSIDGLHEHGDLVSAMTAVFMRVDLYHLLANSICITGALFFFNALTVVREHIGKGGLVRLFISPRELSRREGNH